MSRIVKVIGSIIVALVMYSISGLTVCAFVYDWHWFTKILLVIWSVVQIMVIVAVVYYKVEEEET